MQTLLRQEFGGLTATIAHTSRSDGDLSPSAVPNDVLEPRRRSIVDHPWQVLYQVHSDRVITVEQMQRDRRPVADALVTSAPGIALAVHSGDCVPVGFVHDAGIVAAAHAGWKGLEAGVLESTARRLRETAGSRAGITAVVGPHIRADRYEFGSSELDRLANRFGDAVRSQTTEGTAALDMTAAIAAELDRLDITVAAWSPDCTSALQDKYWSHRARSEPGRFALIAWLEQT